MSMFRTASVSLFLTTAALAETHVIECIGMSFVPHMVNVVPGDVIRWEYVSGLPHTATSGSPCLYDGLFHGSVASFNPVYEWKVPNDVPEDIPFMCIPHCNEGMTGIIYVDLGYTTWTVDDDGKADFNNIQAAVDAASDGDEIVVYPGTYTSTQDGHVVNMLGKAVTLRSSDPSDPDVVAATIIDGEDARRGLACFNDETSKTIISGFTITNGNGVGFDYNGNGDIDWWEEAGGGMYNNSSSPMLENCTFEINTAAYDGGGMYNFWSSPTLNGCTFTSNHAGFGGGMSNDNSSPTLTDSTFTNNTATFGGGMGNYNSSSPTLTDCTFTGNTATYNGGGMYNYKSNPTLTDTTVCGNSPDQIYGDWTDNGGNWVADECPECPDINGDGIVNVSDMLAIIDQWGLSDSPADLNFDGIVDVTDLLIVVGNWGECA